MPTGYPRDPQSLGQHVRKHRIDLGLRQGDVAAAIGVSAGTIQAWENEHTEPDLRSIPAVIRFLGHNPRSLPSTLADQIRHPRKAWRPPTWDLARGIGVDQSRVQDRSLGPRLRAARRARGLSIQDLAQRFEVDPTTISRWEHGRSTPFARYVPGILEIVEEELVPDHAPLGDRIRAYRRRHGLTQRDLADRLRIHQGTLSDWELGLHPPCERLRLIVEEFLTAD